MKSLRLLKYSFSRLFIKELFLVLQLTLMLLFALSILSPVDSFIEKAHQIDKMYLFDFTEAAFFNPNVAAYQIHETDDATIRNQINSYLSLLSEDPDIDKMLRLSYNSTQIYTGQSKQDPHTGAIIDETLTVNFLVYNEEYAEEFRLETLDGSFELSDAAESIPIAVSESLSEFLPVGTLCAFDLSGTGHSINCIVAGILPDDAIIPSTYGFSSFPSLANIGTKLSDVEGAHFIVALVDETILTGLNWEYSCFILPREGIDIEDICARINDESSSIGSCYTVNEIVTDSFQSLLRSNSEMIFECVLLSLIALFGYGGYLYLSVCGRQKDFSVLYILGLTRTQSLILNTFSGAILLCISFIFAWLTYPYFQDFIGIYEGNTLGSVSITFSILFFTFILLLSYITAFRQLNKVTTISLYQGGD